jgi:hypothetical protein
MGEILFNTPQLHHLSIAVRKFRLCRETVLFCYDEFNRGLLRQDLKATFFFFVFFHGKPPLRI